MTKPSQKNILIGIFCVFLLIFIAYLPALQNGFVNWDDDAHLFQNQFIQSFNVQDIFTTTVNRTYIPLTSLSFAIEYYFFGEDPFVYHFNNVLLHLLVTGFVFQFGLRIGLSLTASTVGALIFGLHPMHVESVAWVTERKDVLYAFFYMLALLCYCSYVSSLATKRKGILLVATMVLGVLSALAKPMALSLPFVLLVLDWFLKRDFSPRLLIEKVSVGALLVPVVWMTYVFHMRSAQVTFPESILTWLWCFAFHVRKFLWPDVFVLFHAFPKPVTIANIEYVFAVVFLCGLSGLLILYRRNRLFVFAFLFYFASIFFLLRMDQAADANMVADRFMYLPSLGICLLLGEMWASGFLKIKEKKVQRIGFLILSILITGFLSIKTFYQCQVWRNGVALWGHQISVQDKGPRALFYKKLAEAHTVEDSFQKMLSRYREGESITPKEQGQIQQIMKLYEKALAIKPDYANVYYNLGMLSMGLGNNDAAENYFHKAISLDINHFDVYYELGEIYQKKGRIQEAVDFYQKAIAVNPENRAVKEKVRRALLENGLDLDFAL